MVSEIMQISNCPNAGSLSNNKGALTVSAEIFGKGIDTRIQSQDDLAKILDEKR